jgi:alkylhydroperoxidase family enzyme
VTVKDLVMLRIAKVAGCVDIQHGAGDVVLLQRLGDDFADFFGIERRRGGGLGQRRQAGQDGRE